MSNKKYRPAIDLSLSAEALGPEATIDWVSHGPLDIGDETIPPIIRFRIASDGGAAPDTSVYLEVWESDLRGVILQLRRVVRSLERFREGDVGGPTPEMKRRLTLK